MSPLELVERHPLQPRTREEKLAICAGSVSLSPEDRVELLAVLASDPDADIAERARNVLAIEPAEHFLAGVARPDTDLHLFSYCADNLAQTPGIADALAKNAACPAALITSVASHLSTHGIQALFDNLERFSSDPQLVDAVAVSAAVSAEQRDLYFGIR